MASVRFTVAPTRSMQPAKQVLGLHGACMVRQAHLLQGNDALTNFGEHPAHHVLEACSCRVRYHLSFFRSIKPERRLLHQPSTPTPQPSPPLSQSTNSSSTQPLNENEVPFRIAVRSSHRQHLRPWGRGRARHRGLQRSVRWQGPCLQNVPCHGQDRGIRYLQGCRLQAWQSPWIPMHLPPVKGHWPWEALVDHTTSSQSSFIADFWSARTWRSVSILLCDSMDALRCGSLPVGHWIPK